MSLLVKAAAVPVPAAMRIGRPFVAGASGNRRSAAE
jgi:hypothetical protein